jgi:hypothetical protein
MLFNFKTKNMNKISTYTFLIGTVIISSFSACLKDSSQPDFTQNKPIIELPIGSSNANGAGNSISVAFTQDEVPSDYFVYVNYAAPDANPQDVTVTLAVNESALTKFNQANDKNYTLLPAAGYTLPSNKVIIPAGQRKVQFPIKINTINLDPTKTYALPVTITDGGGFTVSGNFGTIISVITLKNKWDGVYTVTGTMNDTMNGALTGSYPRTVQLITQGANTVAIYDPGNNAFAHAILNGGANSTYGTFSPVFTIDPIKNTITGAVNYYGQPAPNGRSAKLDPTGENKFIMSANGKVPVSLKTKYILVQDGTDRTFFDESWTFKSAR